MKNKFFKIRNVPRNSITSDDVVRAEEGGSTARYQAGSLQSIAEIATDRDGQFLQLVSMFQTFLKSNNNKENTSTRSYQVEARDREVLIPMPEIINNKIPQNELKTWITSVVKTICSASFNYFFKKEMNYEQAKIYCSENIFKNIVILSSNYSLSASEFELIDTHIKKGVLTYLGTKYPLTDSTEINKKLEQSVHEVDNIDAPANNYFNTSNVIFQYRDSGDYNDLIMRLLNDLMGIIDKQNEDEITNYQDFEGFMSTIFEKVEDEEWMRKHDKDQILNQLKLLHQRSDADSFNSPEIINTSREDYRDKKEQFRRRAEEKQKYKSKVKEYTHYLIGRKIPQNTSTFSESQIQNGNISIKSPTILRILTKWCGELHDKYTNSYFSNRSESVKVQRGENVNSLLAWMRRLIDSKLEVELKVINQAMADLFKNNYEMQANIIQQELNLKGSEFIDHIEKISGKFSFKVVKNLHMYIITYLNKLIHGLLKASKEFFDQAGIFDYTLWPSPPNLLSFKIGDLMRCKCSSKEKEILRIYKELHRISRENPEKLKIIRIKNRLRSGTNDILMNIRFNNQITCEIQLGIKSKASDFIKCSNLFHHYLYELERSIFGPLTQLSSIWNSLDRRTDIYRDLVDQEQSAAALLTPTDHTCQKLKKRFEMMPFDKPFVCNHCNRTYHHSNYLKHHVKCNLCAYLLCANCRLQEVTQEQLKNTIISSPQLRQVCKGRVAQNKQIPIFGVCISVQSSQAYHQLFTLVTYQKTKYLLGKRDEEIYEIYKINSKRLQKKFRKKFIIFEVESNEISKKIEYKEAVNKYILPLMMRDSFKKEKESINLMDLQLTTEECQEILSVGTRSQKENVRNLFLVDNKVLKIPFDPEEFPNIRWLTLSRNPIKSFAGIEKLQHLKNLICVSCQLTEFPAQIYQCASLEHISFPSNQIPSFDDRITNLTKLLSLQLSNNSLTALPESLFECISLTSLKMDGNQLTYISDNISKLQNLEVLVFSSNLLTSVTEKIGELPNLREIYLAKNNELNTLPISLSNLKKIVMFDISTTQINTIPIPAQGWPNLRLLNIESTQIPGLTQTHFSGEMLQVLIVNSLMNFEFPENGNYKALKSLEAKFINLSSLPTCVAKMMNLQKLSLEGNYLSDLSLILSLSNLEDISLNNCNLSAFPDLHALRKLKKMNISSNPMISVMPQQGMEYPLLEEFICTDCGLTQLSSSMLNWKSLKRLDLKTNCISRFFDEETEARVVSEKIGWPNLKYAYLNANQLTQFPEAILNSPQVLELHVSSNQITCMPASIKNLTLLRQIEMNYNQVEILPPEFGQLANMSGAYLSCNKFTKVPLFIKDMRKLEHFYMDYMDITEVECEEWVLKVEGINMGNLKATTQALKDSREQIAPPNIDEDKIQEQ